MREKLTYMCGADGSKVAGCAVALRRVEIVLEIRLLRVIQITISEICLCSKNNSL